MDQHSIDDEKIAVLNYNGDNLRKQETNLVKDYLCVHTFKNIKRHYYFHFNKNFKKKSIQSSKKKINSCYLRKLNLGHPNKKMNT